LQDVKNSYINEQKEFEKKIKTQEGFFNHPKQNNFLRPNTEGNNMQGTMGSNFGLRKIEGDIINDPSNNLEGEMDHLSKDDLKERLIVAEKVMKSLFQRNKELEEKNYHEQKTAASTSDNVLMCSNCQGNSNE
jgi:hypothetical protein